MTLKELIKAANDRPLTEVHVPEWDATVYLRALTARERDQIVALATREEGKEGSDRLLSVTLVGRCMCDVDGRRVFEDADLAALADKSGAVVDRLFAKAMEINGIGLAAQRALSGN